MTADTTAPTAKDLYDLSVTLAEAVKLLAADRTVTAPLTVALPLVSAAADSLAAPAS